MKAESKAGVKMSSVLEIWPIGTHCWNCGSFKAINSHDLGSHLASVALGGNVIIKMVCFNPDFPKHILMFSNYEIYRNHFDPLIVKSFPPIDPIIVKSFPLGTSGN